jgi:hypothetical protein
MKALIEKFRSIDEAQGRTYKQAMEDLIEGLRGEGWKVSGPLKVRHATSPDKQIRVWFKAQSIYMTQGVDHNFKNARSMHVPNIKNMSVDDFLRYVDKWAD